MHIEIASIENHHSEMFIHTNKQPSPPLEPPTIRLESYGLRHRPCTGFELSHLETITHKHTIQRERKTERQSN